MPDKLWATMTGQALPKYLGRVMRGRPRGDLTSALDSNKIRLLCIPARTPDPGACSAPIHSIRT